MFLIFLLCKYKFAMINFKLKKNIRKVIDKTEFYIIKEFDELCKRHQDELPHN